MPEEVNNRSVFSLLEVTRSIQNTLSERYQSIFWVKAEMNRLNHYPHSGHCYPELVQKAGGKVIAEMKGIIWREDYLRINALFLRILKEPLKNGITILFAAKITYDPVYGLTLRIIDIDPSYSLGDLEKEKNETIARLREEMLFDRNRMHKLPVLPKRIAVISVQTSKGYSDFLSIVDNNPFGYRIFHMLFPAVLQGEKAIDSIIYQLNRIFRIKDHFDAIAIIRGGGGDVGLNCYNSYRLASMVAASPLPVLTGIGHSTNETVTEMVSFKNAITPTELGGYLIQQFHNFAVPVQQSKDKICELSKRMIKNENSGLIYSVKFFRSVTTNILQKNHSNLDNALISLSLNSVNNLKREKRNQDKISEEIKGKISLYFRNYNSKIDLLTEKIKLLDPVNILKRGYSITKFKGKTITSVDDIIPGEEVETVLAKGTFTGKIISVKKEE